MSNEQPHPPRTEGPKPSRIRAAFEDARAEGRTALLPFLTAGLPEPETCLALLVAVADAGADVIELGVPFSDPVADGPTIQRASERALAAGMSLEGALALAAAFRRERPTPLLLFTYLNPVLRRGAAALAGEAAVAGVDGVLICDLPPGEAPEVPAAFREAGLDYVGLVAPTSPEERVRGLAAASSGFVYLIARTGVTGAGGDLWRVERQVAVLRRHTELPIAVGFGVADAHSARRVGRLADGVVVGSAFLDRLDGGGPPAGLAFLRELREALTPAAPSASCAAALTPEV